MEIGNLTHNLSCSLAIDFLNGALFHKKMLVLRDFQAAQVLSGDDQMECTSVLYRGLM